MLTPEEVDQLRQLVDQLNSEGLQGAAVLRRSIVAATRWHLVNRSPFPREHVPADGKVVLVWSSHGNLPYCGYLAAGRREPYFVAYYGDVEITLPIVAWCDCVPPDPSQTAQLSEKRNRRARATGMMSLEEAELLRIVADHFEDEGIPSCQLLRRFIDASTTWHPARDRIAPEGKVVLVRLAGRDRPYCGYICYADDDRERPQFVVYQGRYEIVSRVVAWCDCLPSYGPKLRWEENEPLPEEDDIGPAG